MNVQSVKSNGRRGSDPRRRGSVVVLVAVTLVVVVGFAALAIDVGLLYSAQAEIQRTADAAALAGAWELLDEERVLGGAVFDELAANARANAAYVAESNPVLHDAPVVLAGEDVRVGYMSDTRYGQSALQFNVLEGWNAVEVAVARNEGRGGSIGLFFSRLFGSESQDMAAQATAAFEDAIVGYEVTETSGNAELLPFALHVDSWNSLLAGSASTGDNYAYDADTKTVTSGSDGVLELNLYPGAGADQLTPGNFGTVDIGSPNNSTSDLARQILYGVNASDLAYFGGRLELGEDGTLNLNGDTGLSAGVKDELAAIIGQPRAIPLFNATWGQGNNATYRVVGFAGIRIMFVKLTGPMKNKRVIIQPAVVVDDAAVAEPGPGPSYFVYRPVHLVR